MVSVVIVVVFFGSDGTEGVDNRSDRSYTEDTSGDWSVSSCSNGICIGLDGGVGPALPGTNPNGGIQFGPTWP